jgi:integrase
MQTISRNSEFIFVSPRYNNQPANSQTANSQTANMALKRMGFKGRLVSHGLRALASTTLNEQGFEPDLIEAALAHVDSNQVRTAYNRTDFYKRRIPMMEWWSQHIVNASTESLTIGVKRFESYF